MKTDSKNNKEQQEKKGYETSDVNFRPLLWSGLALLIVGVIVHGLVAWLLTDFSETKAQSRPTPHSLAKQRIQFPGNLNKIPDPRLQESEFLDEKKQRKASKELLNSYGLVDPQTHAVHIPIERAMELLADQIGKNEEAIPLRNENN